MAIYWTTPLRWNDGRPKKHYDMAHTPKRMFKPSRWKDHDVAEVTIKAGRFEWKETIQFTSGGSFRLPKQIGNALAKLAAKDTKVGVIEFLIEELRSLEEYEAEFQERVRRSLKDSTKARHARLAAKVASGVVKPSKRTKATNVFDRDADVVAEVLFRAAGRCERCQNDAPFRTHDNEPYLEVHHLVWLSKDGDDTTDNAIALCPNCHREAHYGDTNQWRKLLPPQYQNKKISTR